MSRFDRRMGTGPYAKSNTSSTTTRRFKPKPNNYNSNLPSRNEIINSENYTKKSVTTTINDVAEKNEKIMNKLKVTKNASERILLNHELRLNTVELSVDCLNNLNSNESKSSIDISLQKNKINTLEKTVNELSDKLILLTQMIEEINVRNESSTESQKNQENSVTMNISDIVEKSVQKKAKKSSTISEEVNEGPTFE